MPRRKKPGMVHFTNNPDEINAYSSAEARLLFGVEPSELVFGRTANGIGYIVARNPPAHRRPNYAEDMRTLLEFDRLRELGMGYATAIDQIALGDSEAIPPRPTLSVGAVKQRIARARAFQAALKRLDR